MNTRSQTPTFATAAAGALLVCGGWITVPSAMAQSRGELLYTAHCISCHTTQMHWRNNRSATNWTLLKAQVRRWQDATSLGWSDSDILAVSRYLNASIYHFKHTTDRLSSADLHGNEAVPATMRLSPDRRP